MEQKKEKIKKYISKNFKWIIFAICIIIFTAITEDVFEKEIMKETLAEKVEYNAKKDTYTEVSINGEKLMLDVEKCQ